MKMAESNKMKEMPVNKLMVQDGNTDDIIYGIAGSLQHCGQRLCWKYEIGK